MRVGVLFAATLYAALPAAAWGQASCTIDPERMTIRDHGSHEAIVTYHNSGAGCSNEKTEVLTSDNGIQVEIDLDVNFENTDRERLEVYPFGPDKVSIPPEGILRDGETMEFLITGGTS